MCAGLRSHTSGLTRAALISMALQNDVGSWPLLVIQGH
jgi:hypothetical protein